MSVKRSTLNHSSLLDDEFVSCENCLILFEKSEIEHVADNGTRSNHYFCRPCTKSQIISYTGVLAGCSQGKRFEKKSEKQKMLFSSNPDWCSSCNIAASVSCREDNHVIQSINDLFVERSQRLKVLIDQTNLACDHTLKIFTDIHSVHKVFLASIVWLQQKIGQWNLSNTATIAQLESLKTTVRFGISPQEDMSSTINQLNQLIAEFNGKYQLATTIQSKGSNLIQTYRNAKWGSTQSAQASSSAESLPLLANWFSIALSHDHKSCRDILSFLVRLLNNEESVPGSIPVANCTSDETLLSNQNNQVKDDCLLNLGTETVNRQDETRCIQPVLKRQLEEVSGSRTPLTKKPRLQSPDQRDDEQLHPNISQSSTVNLALKEMQVATVKKQLSQLTCKLQDAENKLQLSERKVAAFTEEKARQLKEKEIPIVRLETDLTLHFQKVELAVDPKAKANQDSSIHFKLGNRTGENNEIVLILTTADVEQLHLVRKLLDQGRSGVAVVFQERTNQTTLKGSQKHIIDEGSIEKRCQLQKQMEEVEKALEKSITELIEARMSKDHLLLTNVQMQEEIRKAKEESQKLQSKMMAAEAKHVQEINQFGKYKTRLDGLQMQFQKLVNESPVFYGQRYVTLTEAAEVKAKMKSILKMDEDQQVNQQNELGDNLKKTDRLRPTPSQQEQLARLDEAFQVRPLGLQVLPRRVSKVVTQKKKTPFNVFNFNVMAELILMELYSKGTSLRYHSCIGCKSLVDTRYYCNQCPNIIYCIPCYQKEKHCHEMEILGFDLDVQQLPANCKTIEEAQNSRIERRIDAFLHCLQCSSVKCRALFCIPLKLIIAHCRLCTFQIKKSTTENSLDSKNMCTICGELVALIIYHAKLCTTSVCLVPHCSTGKRWIRDITSKFLPIQKQTAAIIKDLSSEPRAAAVTPNNMKKELEPSKLANDIAVMANAHCPVASEAEKLKKRRGNIIMMIHAHECNQQQNQGQQCFIPQCLAMKKVLLHIRSCVNLQPCQPHCRPTRMFISHLKNCTQPDCGYCSAITELDRYNAITGPNRIVVASELPSLNFYTTTERVHDLPQLSNNYPAVSNAISVSRVL